MGSHLRGHTTSGNGGICHICNKSFRQLRSHIADVHIPTPTACPLCGKVFSSKHKMFGHKYRSCPNRTKNLVRHLELLDHTVLPGHQQSQQLQQLADPLQDQLSSELQQQQQLSDTPSPPGPASQPPAQQF